MKKILISILAGMSLTGSALAYELVKNRDLKKGFQPDGKWWNETLSYVCVMEDTRELHWDKVLKEFPEVDNYFVWTTTAEYLFDEGCHYSIKGEAAAEVVAEIPEPVETVDDERVCTRIEGCEVDLNAETPEEYCPTCVWKSELKKIKINFI